ncbi:hypothetical protein NKH14_22940 [Mesorhizobium sp. M1380]|uniref:hypothetical protein n=1 Tax=Mesorhizobium sp. M1380 TaxID=2957093 RepID=UPI00333B5188
MRYAARCSVAPPHLAWPQPKLIGARIMGDSDNTTTLPFVTRRRVLAGGMIASTAFVVEKSALAGDAAATNLPSDPALALWRAWEKAHKLTERLCRSQQRLEAKLVESVGFPCFTVRLPGGEDISVHSIEALNEVLGKEPEMAAVREKVEADLAAHQARWDAVAEETGYAEALRAEREASGRTHDLLEAFSTTPATTLAGLAGKLDAVLREGEAGEECSDFPWPQIRSALGDLVRIAQQTMPEQCFHGEQPPNPRQAAGWLLFPRLKTKKMRRRMKIGQPNFPLQRRTPQLAAMRAAVRILQRPRNWQHQMLLRHLTIRRG